MCGDGDVQQLGGKNKRSGSGFWNGNENDGADDCVPRPTPTLTISVT